MAGNARRRPACSCCEGLLCCGAAGAPLPPLPPRAESHAGLPGPTCSVPNVAASASYQGRQMARSVALLAGQPRHAAPIACGRSAERRQLWSAAAARGAACGGQQLEPGRQCAQHHCHHPTTTHLHSHWRQVRPVWRRAGLCAHAARRSSAGARELPLKMLSLVAILLLGRTRQS